MPEPPKKAAVFEVREEMAEEIQLAKQNASRIEEEAAMNTRNEQRALVALGQGEPGLWKKTTWYLSSCFKDKVSMCMCVHIYIVYIYIHIRIHRHACIHIIY